MAPLVDPNVDVGKNEGIKEWLLQEVYSGDYPDKDPLMADVHADDTNVDHEFELGGDLTGFGLRHRSISLQYPASHFGIDLL